MLRNFNPFKNCYFNMLAVKRLNLTSNCRKKIFELTNKTYQSNKIFERKKMRLRLPPIRYFSSNQNSEDEFQIRENMVQLENENKKKMKKSSKICENDFKSQNDEVKNEANQNSDLIGELSEEFDDSLDEFDDDSGTFFLFIENNTPQIF